MAKTETPNTNPDYELKAVVDIGSTSIRMVVAQIHPDGTFQTLDTLNQSVAIGSDSFTRGSIARSTIEDCVKVMRSFSMVLKEYNIDLRSGVRAVATSAVREARNRDEFLDRIYMATDINVEVIEGAEVNRLTFLGIRPLLKTNASLRSGNLLVFEVGGGSTEFLGLEDGRVEFAHTYRMGAFRLRENMDAQLGSEARRLELLKMEIDVGVRQCRDAVAQESGKHVLLLMGGEARTAANVLHKERGKGSLSALKVVELARLAEKVLGMDVEKVARKYHLPFKDAQTLGTALLAYVRLAEVFGLKKVHVCDVTLRDGLLAEAALGTAWTEDFVEQILNSVREVGRRYQLDEAHAECVKGNALAIFHAMQNEHRLGYRYEVILTVAALLHDVGVFIGTSSHHKHAKYIIEYSDLFGLGEEDVALTALVARYHRGAVPRGSHPGYDSLSREQRLVVNKLAAMLRAADALDRSHTQAIRGVKVVLGEGQVILEAERPGEYAAEKRALVSKGKMFEQVYGRTVALRAKRR
ncbi:Exopolyphosphatase [Pontiella desulfatans]|uniref:Exopolyphosphatase n=1 Tax=Pontiella desulfatans TaxID=2750659 RepID=A0A6C2TZV7_PONDE|nr:Ppx/GppA phosphatase family protein [Pontiella desulfatans]VGO13258.1 Exopolyphosphatase [Pontiella desulfatans]